MFESGANLIYLAEKTGLFMPTQANERSVGVQWLMGQRGGLGPMHGQANVFNRSFPEKIPSAIKRYQDETVMDAHLADQDYLAGDYSIADMACWPWVMQHDRAGVRIDDLSHLKRWLDEIGARPAVKRGFDVRVAQVQPYLETGRAFMAG